MVKGKEAMAKWTVFPWAEFFKENGKEDTATACEIKYGHKKINDNKREISELTADFFFSHLIFHYFFQGNI